MWITKTLTFDSAHMLSNYEGKCANLHGHTYRVTVSIETDIDLQNHMVMDYNEIKKVFDAVDHAIIFSGAGIRDTAEENLLRWAVLHDMRRYVLPDNCKCTAEDMAQHFAEVIYHLFFTYKCHVIVDLSETVNASARGEVR